MGQSRLFRSKQKQTRRSRDLPLRSLVHRLNLVLHRKQHQPRRSWRLLLHSLYNDDINYLNYINYINYININVNYINVNYINDYSSSREDILRAEIPSHLPIRR